MRAGASNGDVSVAAARQRHIEHLRRTLESTVAVEQGLRRLHPDLLGSSDYVKMRGDYLNLNVVLRDLLTATIELLEAEAERERRHPQCNHPHAD